MPSTLLLDGFPFPLQKLRNWPPAPNPLRDTDVFNPSLLPSKSPTEQTAGTRDCAVGSSWSAAEKPPLWGPGTEAQEATAPGFGNVQTLSRGSNLTSFPLGGVCIESVTSGRRPCAAPAQNDRWALALSAVAGRRTMREPKRVRARSA